MANREHKAYPKPERPRTTRPKHAKAGWVGHRNVSRADWLNPADYEGVLVSISVHIAKMT